MSATPVRWLLEPSEQRSRGAGRQRSRTTEDKQRPTPLRTRDGLGRNTGAGAFVARGLVAALAGAGCAHALAQDPTTLTAIEAAKKIRKGEITS
jgi:hypothetical protein